VSVRLEWAGRDDRPIETAGATLVEVERGDGRGRLIAGDNLEALRALVEEGVKVDLAYLDPPYMSGVDYSVVAPPGARGDGKNGARTHAYGDRWNDRTDYLDMLWPRLRLVHRLLAPHGSIWVQVDHRAAFLVHALLDELFGPQRFRNAIVWRRAPPLGRQVQSGQFPRNVDTLIVYAKGDRPKFRPLRVARPLEVSKARWDEARKAWFTLAPRGDYTDASIARLDEEGRVHRTASGKVYVKYFLEADADGSPTKARAVDSMWDDVAAIRHVALAERTGYPTQKPEKLLERVIQSTSDEGDLVLDPFSGSGTTAYVAAKLGRRFLGIDRSPVAMATARKRLERAGVKPALLRTREAAIDEAPPAEIQKAAYRTARRRL
jgi:DNA modification methylase